MHPHTPFRLITDWWNTTRVSVLLSRQQCRRNGGWGSRYKLPGPGCPKGSPGPGYVAHVFVFLGSYHYLSIVQINPFRPSPNHSATKSQSFTFSVNIFRGPTLAGAPEKIFSQRPEPALGGPGSEWWIRHRASSECLCYLTTLPVAKITQLQW